MYHSEPPTPSDSFLGNESSLTKCQNYCKCVIYNHVVFCRTRLSVNAVPFLSSCPRITVDVKPDSEISPADYHPLCPKRRTTVTTLFIIFLLRLLYSSTVERPRVDLCKITFFKTDSNVNAYGNFIKTLCYSASRLPKIAFRVIWNDKRATTLGQKTYSLKCVSTRCPSEMFTLAMPRVLIKKIEFCCVFLQVLLQD